MKKISFSSVLVALCFTLFSAHGNAQPLKCRLDSYSLKDGASINNLNEVSENRLTLDFGGHHFQIDVDESKGIIEFQIGELRDSGPTPIFIRASGLAPIPSSNTIFLVKYLTRDNKDSHSLKCFFRDSQ